MLVIAFRATAREQTCGNHCSVRFAGIQNYRTTAVQIPAYQAIVSCTVRECWSQEAALFYYLWLFLWPLTFGHANASLCACYFYLRTHPKTILIGNYIRDHEEVKHLLIFRVNLYVPIYGKMSTHPMRNTGFPLKAAQFLCLNWYTRQKNPTANFCLNNKMRLRCAIWEIRSTTIFLLKVNT